MIEEIILDTTTDTIPSHLGRESEECARSIASKMK